ncbi:hypothetical protein [Ktedonobacter racemifer]|uniref:Uncharacterized protein n=1 Tax=Ktedonobacter racemifer DSM 44963 TaxID=485913 RepID=D6TCA1_KTERA|nr:hypothetical protein [Ktedonobacter racemifer]EFH89918.1 hypothetical protein Krac_11507 [Ktedonobacter racemifer DSM 44963]
MTIYDQGDSLVLMLTEDGRYFDYLTIAHSCARLLTLAHVLTGRLLIACSLAH